MKRLIGHIATVAFLTGTGYILALYAAFALYGSLYGPWDRDRGMSGLIVGLAVSVLPYAIAGLYARQAIRERRFAAATAIVPVICEKLAIHAIGASFVAAGGDGGGDGVVTPHAVFAFVRAEALPYCTPGYWLWGTAAALAAFAAVYAWPKRVAAVRRP